MKLGKELQKERTVEQEKSGLIIIKENLNEKRQVHGNFN